MSLDRLLPWLVRAAWGVLPLVAGPSLAAALDPRSGAVRTVATIGLWTAWTLVLLASLVPHPIALTTLRIGAPAGALATIGPVLAGEGSAWAAGAGAVAAGLTMLPETAVWFVNGPAYVNERRLPLRAPGPLVLGPIPLAWAVVVAAPVGAALLLAAEQWVLGGLAGLVGLPAAVVLARSLHSLSRRWVVFVPAGLVLHDPLSLVDPVLFPSKVVESLAPAPADTDALDLTQGAMGLALELSLKEKIPMALTRRGGRDIETGSSARLMFTPTRPGLVLAEARRRRIS